MRCIINKDAVLSQYNAALFRLIPLGSVLRTCLYSSYSRVLDKACGNCGKGPPPTGDLRPGTHVYRLQKFLSKIYGSRSIRQITQITPHNTSPKPTITDHTTSVINVHLRFRTVLRVIIQVSRFYGYKRCQKSDNNQLHRSHKTE